MQKPRPCPCNAIVLDFFFSRGSRKLVSALEASRRPTPQGRRRDAHARQRRDTTTVTEDVSSTIGYMISDSPSDESNMLLQIADSPMSITVDATLWQTYESGIITASSGCGTSIDHAVQLVGFGTDGGLNG